VTTNVLLLRVASGPSSAPAGKRPATRAARRTLFAEAAEILANEASRPITLEEVAHRIATSPRQLQRVFTEHAGLGFRSYLRRLRLSNAADLLTGTDLSVGEIADAVGYGDASQFAKSFKRMYGVSPSRYRAMPDELPSVASRNTRTSTSRSEQVDDRR
jgi:transcriptional regulator GlxA family with amidase domain